MRKWTAIALVALMLFAIVGCGGGSSANTPTGAVENGVKALKEMNTKNLEKYFVDGGDIGTEAAGEEEQMMIDLYKALFAKLAVKVTKEEIDEDDADYATVTADITTIDATEFTTSFYTSAATWVAANPSATEEEAMEWLVKEVKSIASSTGSTTINGVEIYCEKDGEDWKLSDNYDNSDFFEAISGGSVLNDLF